MKQREANIERNRAHEEELRDAFAALANMNSAGGSKKTAGGKKAQEKLANRKLRAMGDQLVKVRRDLPLAGTVGLTATQSVEQHTQQQQQQAESDADTVNGAENGGVRLPATDADPTHSIGPLGTGLEVQDVADDVAKPADNVAKPANDVAKLADGVSEPADDVPEPADDVAKPAGNAAKPANGNAVTRDAGSDDNVSAGTPGRVGGGMDILSEIGDMQWPDWLRKYTAELTKVLGPMKLTEIIRNLALLDMHLGFPSGQVSGSVTCPIQN
jgi:hypothetical protein